MAANQPTKAEPTTAQYRFNLMAHTKEEEDAYNLVGERNQPKPSGIIASVGNLVKGALGAGVLAGHVGYMKAGWLVAVISHVFLGVYVGYCLYILVRNAQVLYKRSHTPSMSYPDVMEAAFSCSESPSVRRWSKAARYYMDFVLCTELFGSCACYQLIIGKTVKQLVENTDVVSSAPLIEGYPNLKVYLAIILVFCIAICMLRHLQWLAPVSIAANIIIGICILVTIYYAFKLNPGYERLKPATSARGFFEFFGMCIFSMSCAGVVLPVENNMKEPHKFRFAMTCAYVFIIGGTMGISFFGYMAFGEKSKSPVTINFPMDIGPKIIKFGIALMIYATHALNFWVPFSLVWFYIKKCHKSHLVLWECFYRAVLVIAVGLIAILFPSIEALMGFLGTFCLCNMAFIWPHIIELLVIWKRPGLGHMRWRLWKCIVLVVIGVVVFVIGTAVSIAAMYRSAKAGDDTPAEDDKLENIFKFLDFFV